MSLNAIDRRHFFAVSATAAAALLAACSSATSPEDEGGDSRTITHALGTTTLTKKPERVLVTTDFVDLDYVLGLGVTPVAYGATGSWDRGELPWQAEATEGVPSFESGVDLNLETISSFEPDLIVGMKTYLEPLADQLNQIAPVVALDWSTTWRDGVEIIGQATYTDSAASIGETEQLIAATAAELGGLDGKTIMIGSYFDSVLYVQGDLSAPGVLLGELGLAYRGYDDTQMASLSLENVDVLGPADILLSFATDPAATATLEQFPVFRALPAVQARAYAPLDKVLGSAFSDNFSPLSAQFTLSGLSEVLQTLASGQGVTIT